MWMPKDTATWLALIALILVIPFNFFSSWAYPKLQDWWAARSRKSLKKRIDKLTASLAGMYEGRGMSFSDEWVLLCAEQLGSLIFWGVNLLALLIILVLGPLLRPVIRHPYVLAVIIATALTTYRVIRDFLMAKIQEFRRFAGPRRKLELEQSIADLTAKLAAREHGKPA
jgi:hypothetical protein